jgi:Domain of unknown function (DUF4352)
VFLAVGLTFENRSDKLVTVSDVLDLGLRDEDGHDVPKLPSDDQQRLVEETIGDQSLDPSETIRGEAVYEVPCDAQRLHLEYKPFGGDTTHTWLIGGVGESASEGEK